jgi:MFS family permease
LKAQDEQKGIRTHMDQKAGPGPYTPPEKTPWPLVLLFIGAGVVASFQVGKAPPVLPLIRLELGMSLFIAGWILSTFNVVGLLLGSVSGALADALGHRRLLLAGLIIQAVSSFIGGMAHSVWLLFLTRTFEGLGFLVMAVSAPALIFQVTRPKDLRIALSGWSCFMPAGMSFIMLIAPLITAHVGWRGLWIVNALILGAYAALTAGSTTRLTRRGEGKRVTLVKIFKDTIRTCTSIGPALLAVIFSTYTLQWIAVMGFLPTLMMEQFGMGVGRASILTALVVAVNVLGNLSGGWLMTRGARRQHLIISASLLMGLFSLAIYSDGIPFWGRYMGCLLFSGIGGLLPAALISGAPVYAPTLDLVATTNGLIMQGSQFGQMVGPPALALVVSVWGGWHVAPWLICTSALLGILLSLWLPFLKGPGREKEKTPVHDPA